MRDVRNYLKCHLNLSDIRATGPQNNRSLTNEGPGESLPGKFWNHACRRVL